MNKDRRFLLIWGIPTLILLAGMAYTVLYGAQKRYMLLLVVEMVSLIIYLPWLNHFDRVRNENPGKKTFSDHFLLVFCILAVPGRFIPDWQIREGYMVICLVLFLLISAFRGWILATKMPVTEEECEGREEEYEQDRDMFLEEETKEKESE